MEIREYIKNRELFTKRADFKFSPLIKLEHIQNTQNTILEYREYYDPDQDNWIEYIQEILGLMGFETDFINPRVGFLQELGLKKSSKILFGISLPGESFTNVTPWLEWSYLLSSLASVYKCQWGLLTNGREICLFDFERKDYRTNNFWTNIESILQDKSEDSFFTIYSVFHYLHTLNGRKIDVEVNNSQEVRPLSNNQLLSKSPDKSTPIAPSTQYHCRESIPPALIRASQVYDQIVHHGLNFEAACEVIAQKNSITTQTVRQDCTLKLHIKSERFYELARNKPDLITHLQRCYPKCTRAIEPLFD